VEVHQCELYFCQVLAHNTADNIPALAWQVVGDEAILVGYNAAMERLTCGGIETALGVPISEFSDPEMCNRLLAVERTGQAVIFESVRKLRTGPGTYRFITVMCPDAGGRVILYAQPLEQLEVEFET